MCNSSLIFDFENLRTKYRVVEMLNETEPQHDFGALLTEHSGDTIGFHAQTPQKLGMDPMEKKALYHGVSTLLHTTDERS